MSKAAKEEVLRAALQDALEGLEEMLAYVPGYFQNKWALPDYIERARATLEATRDPA